MNVAVSEVSIMRMRACGQLANNINPIQAVFRFHGISLVPRRSDHDRWFGKTSIDQL